MKSFRSLTSETQRKLKNENETSAKLITRQLKISGKHLLFIKPFSTNVRIIDKPRSWFLLAKCLKNTCY